jgi:hypothetical protein
MKTERAPIHDPGLPKPAWQAPRILRAGSMHEIVRGGKHIGKGSPGPDADGLRGTGGGKDH